MGPLSKGVFNQGRVASASMHVLSCVGVGVGVGGGGDGGINPQLKHPANGVRVEGDPCVGAGVSGISHSR